LTSRQLVHINLPVSKRFDVAVRKQAKLAGKSKSAYIRDMAAQAMKFQGDPSPFSSTRAMPGS
jgi:hypothetical protein